ncbi:MAG TPA: ATP-binding protein [Candidatus Omnitrophota bacterium]|nr:ATP-binding protein [Candidatus Omnitrophota bacterium]HRZ14427.1 ATP-binding protein [Candidatus Omnitrophota bacterium]
MTDSFRADELLFSDLKMVTPFIDGMIHKIRALGCQEEDAFNIRLALEEALTNAIRHGNASDPRRQVSVHIEADSRQVAMDVHDQGKGFDFLHLPDPTRREYVNRPSGRGVFLMRKLMDEVEFYDQGSGVRMVKRLGGGL